MILISAQQLCIARGGRPLLGAVSFELEGGQALHIAGANGVGKTSLLETLAGLRAADSGELQGAAVPDGFHWIGHRDALNPALSVQENIEFWCGLNGVSTGRMESALDRWQIKPLRHHRARSLSVGQRRRAALARLLLTRRPLWLLDEPLSGLDSQGGVLFAEILNSHLALGGGALITSHQELPALPGLRRMELQ